MEGQTYVLKKIISLHLTDLCELGVEAAESLKGDVLTRRAKREHKSVGKDIKRNLDLLV